jgi:preprotein translocase subunit SecG
MIIRITAVLAVLFLILSAGCISTDTSMEKAAEKTEEAKKEAALK